MNDCLQYKIYIEIKKWMSKPKLKIYLLRNIYWRLIMDIILTIVIGFFVGLFARALVPGRSITGFIMTTLLGIAGALVGKFVGESLGIYGEGQSAGFFMSLLGAMLILFFYQLFINRYPNT